MICLLKTKKQCFDNDAAWIRKKWKRKSRKSSPSQNNSKCTSTNTVLHTIFKLFIDWEILLN